MSNWNLFLNDNKKYKDSREKNFAQLHKAKMVIRDTNWHVGEQKNDIVMSLKESLYFD